MVPSTHDPASTSGHPTLRTRPRAVPEGEQPHEGGGRVLRRPPQPPMSSPLGRKRDLGAGGFVDTLLGRGYIQGRRIINVEGADLSYASLAYAKLNDAFLFGVDLRHANLQNANLTNAYLYGANVQDTKLPNVVGLTLSAVGTTENWREATFTGHLCRLLPLPRRVVTIQGDQSIPYLASTPIPTLIAWVPLTPQPTIGAFPTATAITHITQLSLPPLSTHDLTTIPNLLSTVPPTPFSLNTPNPAIYSSGYVEEGC